MVKELSGTDPELSTAIERWQHTSDCRVTKVAALEGSGNRSYLLTDDNNRRVVLRLNGETEHLGVNRTRELEILSLLEGQQIAAKCLATTAQFAVFEYLPEQGTATEIEIAHTLRRLHTLDAQVWRQHQPNWTPVQTIKAYLDLMPEAKPAINQPLAQLEKVNWDTSPYGICHIDLNPGNIIATPDGTRFIDWEYSRYGPTVYDLAVLLQNDPELDERRLLSAYSLEVDASLLAHARLSYCLIEILWFALTTPETWPLERVQAACSELQLI